MSPKVFLKPGKEKPIRSRHPWIFSGALAKIDGAKDGETVGIYTAQGEFLARGCYNSHSQIAVRIWTWQDEPIDRAFFLRRIEQAIAMRARLELRFHQGNSKTTAFRLINAESDLLPGLIVDAYDIFLVVQFLTLGMERQKQPIIGVLSELLSPRGIYERSDVAVREKENLPQLKGLLWGEDPPPLVEILENGFSFLVNLRQGHKSGFYLDQRENRQRTANLLAPALIPCNNLDVLNAFSYTGAFGIYLASLNPGIRVVNLDSSSETLSLARENFTRNQLSAQAEYLEGDAFLLLRKFRDQARQFDLIVLDPPKFAYSQSQLMQACRGYKDLNLLALKLLRPGGHLITFSCSSVVNPALFQKVVFAAATDAGRHVQLIAKLGHPADHPILLSFPESEYLKGLLALVQT